MQLLRTVTIMKVKKTELCSTLYNAWNKFYAGLHNVSGFLLPSSGDWFVIKPIKN
jgi:hypothetical protein